MARSAEQLRVSQKQRGGGGAISGRMPLCASRIDHSVSLNMRPSSYVIAANSMDNPVCPLAMIREAKRGWARVAI